MRNGSKAESTSPYEGHQFERPHVSSGGHVSCTFSKCKNRLMKSNATVNDNDKIFKAMMFTNNTKIFIVNSSMIAECICGAKYDVNDIVSGNRGIFFEKNKNK